MKYVISESTRTVTVETTGADSSETLERVERKVRELMKPTPASWQEVRDEAACLIAPAIAIDETPDPLGDARYHDTDCDQLAAE